MDTLISLLHSYNSFISTNVNNRFFKHKDLLSVLENLKSNKTFEITKVGLSYEGRSLNLVRCGRGSVRIFLWSQMHGNEATATMALLDLFNFLGDEFEPELKNSILQNCTLYILPMVNPDGAEIFQRRNAQEIDINRDFHSQASPEGIILRKLRDEIQPHFGFNLHDQTTMWSAGNLGNPATISLLAPAYDDALSINGARQEAMQVIAVMNSILQKVIPGHVGRFDDEYEMRAFGDNFQAAGTSTILIEAGGYADDPEKQYIRKLVFLSIIGGLLSISQNTFVSKTTEEQNAKNELASHYSVDIGLIAKETVSEDLKMMNYTYIIGDIGDLSNRFGYKDINCESFNLIQTKKMKFEEPADIILMDGVEVLLAIENGVITNSSI